MEAVRVLEFTDDGSVYISTHPLSKLRELEEEAEDFVKGRNRKSDPLPKRGEVCLAQRRGKWCRGEVNRAFVSVKRGTLAEVFLIDYGETINVGLQELVSANESSLCLEPPLAVLYSLSSAHKAALPPSINPPWHEAVTNIFNNMIGGVGRDYGWGFKAQGVVRDGCIELYHFGSNENKISFNKMLVTCGFLVPCEPRPMDISCDSIKTPSLSYSTELTSETDPSLNKGNELFNSKVTPDPPTLNQFMPVRPKKHQGVYVEGVRDWDVWDLLEDTPFSSSVCSALEERGFRLPTAVQSHGWPHIWENKNTVLISPHDSGKTLAYLLPLLCQSKLTQDGGSDQSYEPRVLILVTESYKSWSISNQSKTILSWLNAACRFRCCPSYVTAESAAICTILNGIDVLVATPPSVLRLVDREIINLSGLEHVVFDDVPSLYNLFFNEVNRIMKLYARTVSRRESGGVAEPGWHVVVCFSLYHHESWEWLQQYLYNPVTVVTNPLELVVMKRLKCQALCSSFPAHVVSLLAKNKTSCSVVVCTDNEEADKLIQILGINSINVVRWRQGSLTPDCNISVTCDSDLPSLDVGGVINHLIHYSLPRDKSSFVRRHTLLLPAISASHSPCLTVFVSDDCLNQSRDLLQLLQRMGQSAPDELNNMAEKRKKRQQKKLKTFDLCHHLKAYGECLNGSECKMAHSVLELSNRGLPIMSQSTVPRNGVVKVKVRHVSSPVQLWVQILDHTPLLRGDCPIKHAGPTMSQLSLDLALFYSSPEHCVLHANPSEGDFCGLREPSGEYYRALILEFSAPLGLYFHHKEQAKVRLIDQGGVHIVDVNQLLTLPDKFLTTPPLVVEAYICGLRPLDQDKDWPPEAISSACRLFNGRTLIGRVAISHGSTLWLDPIEERVTLDGLRITTALFVPQKEIVKAGVGCANPAQLDRLKEALDRGSDPVQEEALMFDDYRRVSLSEVDGTKVTLTAIESLSSLYVQPITAEPILDSVVDRLNLNPSKNGFEKLLYSEKRFIPGEMCAALFPYDKKWYRACVMEVKEHVASRGEEKSEEEEEEEGEEDEEEVEEERSLSGERGEYLCLFVDYGDLEWVGPKDVEPIHKELLEFPFQGVHCSLSGSKGISNDSSYEKIWDVTRERVLELNVVSSDDELVNLFSEDGSNILSFCRSTSSSNSSSDVEDEISLPHSETATILSLIHTRQLPATQFLCHVMAKGNRQSFSIQDVDMLSTMIKLTDNTEYIVNFVNGLSLLMTLEPRYVNLLSSHSGFCNLLFDLIKNPISSDVLIASLRLVKLLALSHSRIPSWGIDSTQLVRMLSNVIQGSSSITVISHSIDTITSLIMEGEITNFSLLDKILSCLTGLMSRDSLVCPCVRLVSVLLMMDSKGRSCVDKYLRGVALSCKNMQPEIREWLMYSLQHLPPSSLINPPIDVLSSWNQTGLFNCIEKQLFNSISPENGGSLQSFSPSYSFEGSQEEEDSSAGGGQTDSGVATDNYSTTVLTPKVLWSQTRNTLCLSIQLRGCEQPVVKCHNNDVTFRCFQQQGIMYGFSLQLFGSVVEERCHLICQGGEVLIKATKAQDLYWPRVTRNKKKPTFVAVDCERWREETSSSGDETQTARDRAARWSHYRNLRVQTEKYAGSDESDYQDGEDDEEEINYNEVDFLVDNTSDT